MSDTTTSKHSISSNPGVNRIVDDVKTMGHELKAQAVGTRDVLVRSTRELAADTKEAAQEKYEAVREQLRAKSEELRIAKDAQLAKTRQGIVAEPLKAIAIAAGIGFVLGRFIFRGR